ncbi:MAG: hypothetical protein AAF488_16465 [Planctomycetota bacterium]
MYHGAAEQFRQALERLSKLDAEAGKRSRVFAIVEDWITHRQASKISDTTPLDSGDQEWLNRRTPPRRLRITETPRFVHLVGDDWGDDDRPYEPWEERRLQAEERACWHLMMFFLEYFNDRLPANADQAPRAFLQRCMHCELPFVASALADQFCKPACSVEPTKVESGKHA